MLRILVVWIVIICRIQAQSASFPLESASVEGTLLSKDVVLELAGLHIGAPVDKAAIEVASQRLSQSGLFESVNYRYAPGPKQGYALTLQVADSSSMLGSTIDISGINEDEAWRWLASKYPSLDHKVPANEAGQQFVSRKLEEHLGAALEGLTSAAGWRRN